MRECPRCGAQVRCHRLEELESELPEQMKIVQRLYKEGEFREAKGIANAIALKNRQLNIPGIDEDLRILFKRIKEKRAATKNTLYA